MLPQTKLSNSHLPTSIFPTTHFPKPSFPPFKSITLQSLKPLRTNLCHGFSIQPLKCSVSVVSKPTNLEFTNNPKPFPAEVSRTIMKLSYVGTFSSLIQEGWPLGFGVRFAVDLNGTPISCLNESNRKLLVDKKCRLHVQLEQSGLRSKDSALHGVLFSLSEKCKVFNNSTDEGL
ncbi:unnamed protein product [Fraxinus pennsylvanica]|uniref:Uncharacterized protein n=1 Tax=Fraxinus pennsylvanica TaxID=56036 RepID=A0AAD1ZR99_9LAMI|nr:unnamed protein product [Fraxinus pennsylvanica]